MRLAARAELLERRREAVAIEVHGRQPEGESAHRRNALLDHVADGVHARRELRRIARDRVLDRPQQQRDARELLTETVVEIVADSLVLALAHLLISASSRRTSRARSSETSAASRDRASSRCSWC